MWLSTTGHLVRAVWTGQQGGRLFTPGEITSLSKVMRLADAKNTRVYDKGDVFVVSFADSREQHHVHKLTGEVLSPRGCL